jgi:hypothetical protein
MRLLGVLLGVLTGPTCAVSMLAETPDSQTRSTIHPAARSPRRVQYASTLLRPTLALN